MPNVDQPARVRSSFKPSSLHRSGIVEAIHQLRVARDGAVKARSAALNALGGLIVTAPEELRQQLGSARRRPAERQSAPRPLAAARTPHAAKAALRSLARRVIDLDAEIKLLDRQLDQLVATVARRQPARVAVSTGHAGTPLGIAGENIAQLRSEASLAAVCGASPLRLATGHSPAPPDRPSLRRRTDRADHHHRLTSIETFQPGPAEAVRQSLEAVQRGLARTRTGTAWVAVGACVAGAAVTGRE
jgi:transposase